MLGWFRKSITLNQLGGVLGWVGWGTSSGQTVTAHSAIDTTAVFCAARVIAEGLAQMPQRVVRANQVENGLTRFDVQPDHWAHRLLAVKPNEWQTPFEFIEGMVFTAALAGGSIAIKNVVGGEVRELLPVPIGAWSVEQLANYSLRVRINYADKTHGYFDLDQVFYLRGPSIDGFQGIAAVRAAREAIGLSRVLEKQQARLAGNGGKPSGVLSFAQKLAPETAVKLRETWQQRFGPDGEGGIAVLDQDAKFHTMTMTNVDAQYIETRKLQVEEIARAFRVQPIMLMQADKAATFASAEQMFRTHVVHTLGPWVARWEAACHRDILAHDPVLRVDLDERNLLRGDFKDQAEYFAKALGAGGTPAWMTQDEVRGDVGLAPLGGRASVLSSGAMMPEGDQNGSV
jgi:HK97 family phage portal protein